MDCGKEIAEATIKHLDKTFGLSENLYIADHHGDIDAKEWLHEHIIHLEDMIEADQKGLTAELVKPLLQHLQDTYKFMYPNSKCCNQPILFNNSTGDLVCSGCRDRVKGK